MYVFLIVIIIIIKNESHSNIIIDRLQGCGLWYRPTSVTKT